MSERHDDAWLIALGTDVSDGRTVDWDAVDHRATDEEARNIVENLKRLEAVIHGHRSADDADGRGAPAVEPPTSHWHHLVLFERVGRGAFGDVYRAWDTKLDREVALKLRTRPPAIRHRSKLRSDGKHWIATSPRCSAFARAIVS